jgi:hypothetical protein
MLESLDEISTLPAALVAVILNEATPPGATFNELVLIVKSPAANT